MEIFVGYFTEEEVKQGIDRLEVDKAMESTGLKYVKTKLHKKGNSYVGISIWVTNKF